MSTFALMVKLVNTLRLGRSADESWLRVRVSLSAPTHTTMLTLLIIISVSLSLAGIAINIAITDRPRRFIPKSPATAYGQLILILLGGPILWVLALWFFMCEAVPVFLKKLVPISILRDHYYKQSSSFATEILERETEIEHQKLLLAELRTQLARINGEYLDLLAEKNKFSSQTEPSHYRRITL